MTRPIPELSSRPVPRACVAAISAYVPGKSKATSSGRVFKLSANENPFGASQKALEAYKNFNGLELYPDGSSTALREAIASVHNLDAAQIICGTGSDELLHLLALAYMEPGDEGIYTEYGFLVYKIAIQLAGGTPVVVKETDYTVDVDAILAAVTDRTKIIYIANPANPTGTFVPFTEIRRLQAALPRHVLLVLDAAYAEYVTAEDYACGAALVRECENVVMTRTFSKIYGLANLRVGWMFAPSAIIAIINRIRGPFNVSGPASNTACAALADQDFIQNAIAHNTEGRTWLTSQLTACGLNVVPSQTNFILVHFPKTAGKTAVDADTWLSARGLITRHVASYGLPDALRITIGTEEANRAVASALHAFMKE